MFVEIENINKNKYILRTGDINYTKQVEYNEYVVFLKGWAKGIIIGQKEYDKLNKILTRSQDESI